MGRVIALLYGVISYVIFLAALLYFIGFLGNFSFLPKTIDVGGVESSTAVAAMVNLILVALFGVPHSVMARPGFKKALTKFVPESVERSTYVMVSNALFILMMWQWRPMTDIVWQAEAAWAVNLLWGVMFVGFGILVYATFLIDHFELFGLKQVLRNLTGKAAASPGFQVSSLYRIVRHPLYVGWLMGIWGGPTMTTGHLVLSLCLTIYILVAIRYEERDLINFHGDTYKNYKERVPGLIPRPGKVHDKVVAGDPDGT